MADQGKKGKGKVVNVTERFRRGEEEQYPAAGLTPQASQATALVTEETFKVMGGHHNYETITEKISRLILNNRIGKGWLFGLFISVNLLAVLGGSILYVLLMGVGAWGINQPVGWGFDIINFVWWIGIGHAGTLISAILLLLHQNWRTSINRFAEAMTLFAVACAGLYPLLHIGRHQYAYWMMPFPNSMGLWPQFRSPLIWDVFAITTYLNVSLFFWLIGLIPDVATLRDRAKHKIPRFLFGCAALGWRGSSRHWHRYNAIYLLLAGLSTPLVLSVHTIVSYDFAAGIVPGWHSTIFPPYFVAGAVFAGFAMVLILAIPLRVFFNLKDLITMKHLENCGKVMLATGMIVFYGYLIEVFFGWYSANEYENYMTFDNRMWGPYAWSYWSLIFCNGIAPQILWWKKMRTSIPVLFIVSLIVSVGMWLERFVIIVTSLSFDFMPSSWGIYYPTFWDYSLYLGTFGLFFTLFLLFCRLLPVIAMAEMRELVHHETLHGHGDASH